MEGDKIRSSMEGQESTFCNMVQFKTETEKDNEDIFFKKVNEMAVMDGKV